MRVNRINKKREVLNSCKGFAWIGLIKYVRLIWAPYRAFTSSPAVFCCGAKAAVASVGRLLA